MCVVSFIGDHYADRWRPYVQPPNVSPPNAPTTVWPVGGPTRAEFDALKREVEDVRELLIKAKAYDEANGEPDCELDAKVDILRRVAELVGVSLDDVLAPGAGTD